VASMGSCFAREIKSVLTREGFSYIAEETHHPASVHASAAWERVYNLFSMRQIFEYTFGQWVPATRWWQAPISGKIQDPYRRIVLYDSLEEAERDFETHRGCSRRALEKLPDADPHARAYRNLGRPNRRLRNMSAVRSVRE